MHSFNRTRQRGSLQPVTFRWHHYDENGVYVGDNVGVASQGTVERMDDVVSKPFVPGRTIVNTPMSKTTSVITRVAAVGSADLYYPGYVGVKHADGERYFDRSGALDSLFAKLDNIDTTPLISEAATSAFADIKKPEVAGLVSIAELRETIHSLLHPINGALNFLKRNALGYRKGKRTSKRNLKGSAADIADQHLSIVFGLLPFISDVQGTLKVLRERIEQLEPQRYTARGSASSHDVLTASGSYVNYSSSNDRDDVFFNDEVIRTVTVRAYILYEAKISLADQLGLSPSEIPRAVWQATTLSFVIDWFANVSQFIAALTPDPSVNIISSGYSVVTVDAKTSHYSEKWTRTGSTGWSGSVDGGLHSDLVTTKIRVPSSLRPFIGLHLKHNMHKDVLDTFKVTAAISLLTQKLQKFL